MVTNPGKDLFVSCEQNSLYQQDREGEGGEGRGRGRGEVMEIKQSKLGGTADLSDIFSSTHNSSTGSVEGSTMYMVGIRGQFVGWGSGGH